MHFTTLEDEFDTLELHVRQAQLLQEVVMESGADLHPALDDLISEVLGRALADVERFGALLLQYGQEFLPGSSLTSAAPITSTAPTMPSAPMCSRSKSADSSTATTGSM